MGPLPEDLVAALAATPCRMRAAHQACYIQCRQKRTSDPGDMRHAEKLLQL